MGLFFKKKNKSGPLKIKVLSCENFSTKKMDVTCDIQEGNVVVKENLIYKPQFGLETIVTVQKIESMMMNLEVGMEGTVVQMCLVGEFEGIVPEENDVLTRG